MRKLAKLLTLAAILWTVPAKASVLSYMYALQPNESHEEISAMICRYADIYRVDPYVIVAIGMTESSLIPNNHRLHNKIITDYGLLQLNKGMLKPLGLNSARLLLDKEYYFDSAIRFLAEKIRMGKGSTYPWSMWHSSTPSLRSAYEQRVLHYLRLAPKYRQHRCTN